MPRTRDPNREQAFEIYKESAGRIDLVEIASQLNLSPGTIRGWKSKDKWDSKLNGALQKNMERSKRKGAQPRNKNAAGNRGGAAPEQNKNAEKFGFFSKYLPEETVSIIQEMPTDPLDVLWDQIQIAYAAIIRAQQIMYVRDRNDMTKERTMSGKTDAWEVQHAWDKQGKFLQAQARAQSELRGLTKQYDELLHKRWDLATEEQKARINVLKSKVEDKSDKPIRITFTKASEKRDE